MCLSSNSGEDDIPIHKDLGIGWMLEFWRGRLGVCGLRFCIILWPGLFGMELNLYKCLRLDGEETSRKSGMCSPKFLVKYIHKMLSRSFCFEHINVTFMNTVSHHQTCLVYHLR